MLLVAPLVRQGRRQAVIREQEVIVCYLGIDPGAHGGLAAYFPRTRGIYLQPLAGMALHEVRDWLHAYKPRDDVGMILKPFAMLEKVGGYIGNEATARGSRMFVFGWHAGMVEAFLCAMSIPYDKVAPITWQKTLDILPRVTNGPNKETEKQWKRRLKQDAKRRFPENKITADVADALLLAEYGYLLREGHLAQ